jgi:hypothetical protein
MRIKVVCVFGGLLDLSLFKSLILRILHLLPRLRTTLTSTAQSLFVNVCLQEKFQVKLQLQPVLNPKPQ